MIAILQFKKLLGLLASTLHQPLKEKEKKLVASNHNIEAI